MSKASTKPTPVKKMLLDYPIEWGEEGLVDEIEFKRLKGKHIKGLGANVSMEVVFKLAGKSTGYPPSFFDELDASDCAKISEIIGDFLDGGQKIGRTALL